MSKFLDPNGLLYFWSLIKTKLSSKVDKVTGKALSTNDYTTAEKTKLSGIEANANKYVHPTSTLTAGAYGDAGESRILTNSGTFKVPLVKTDANGHVIDTVVLTLTLPAGYTLPVATATVLGGVKIGSGLSIANGVTTVTTAPKLAVARTIALAGDVSGSVSFDGSENATITAVIADDSHNHIISNVDGLQTALDTKANATTVDTLNGDDSTEGSVAKTVKDAVEPIIEDVSDHEIRIAVLEGWHPLTSWEDIQKAAKAGVARKYLKVGDLVETSYDGSPAVVELIGINHPFDLPPVGADYGDVISFQFKDCLQNAQYSAPQALYNAVEGLDAGTYTFINSNDSLPYTFTLTQAVPVGGVIVITSWGVGTYEPAVLKTMQADRLTDIETGVAVTQASGGTALAPVNLTPRCRYGANLYIESGIRHFLNDKSESYVWVAQSLYDMPSTYGAGGGFLKRLDADFASVIGPVVKTVARATADGGGQDTMEDKVWLLSRVEMGYGIEGVTTGEQVYERWDGATNAERIKLLSGSPQHWWLRPPSVSTQNLARVVGTDGALYGRNSRDSGGLAPGLAVY